MYGLMELIVMIGKNTAKLKLSEALRCSIVFSVAVVEPQSEASSLHNQRVMNN